MTTEVQAMTDDEARALGERWIKAGGGWRLWMRGVDPDGEAWRIGNDGEAVRERGLVVRYSGLLLPRLWPDLRDPATRGAALDGVRERRGCPEAFLFRDLSRWEVSAWIPNARGRMEAHTLGAGSTEAEALVAVLEAVP